MSRYRLDLDDDERIELLFAVNNWHRERSLDKTPEYVDQVEHEMQRVNARNRLRQKVKEL